MAEEKPLPPSERRKREARDKGNIAKSQLLTGAVTLAVTLVSLRIANQVGWLSLEGLLRYDLRQDPRAPSILLALSFAMLILSAIVGVGCELAQAGLGFRPRLLCPDPKRISPVDGWRRVMAGLRLAWLTLLCPLVVGLVGSWSALDVLGRLRRVGQGWSGDASFNSELFGVNLFHLMTWITGAALSAATLDYWIRRRRQLREIGMTHSELTQELKDAEGDPLIKALRRFRQQEIAYRDLVRKVARSRVVVVSRAKGRAVEGR